MARITKLQRVAAEQLATRLSENGVNYPAHDPFHMAFELLGFAERLNHYNEAECNYGLTDRQQKNAERIERQVREMVPVHIGVKFNGDPRGYALRLLFPDGKYNTWGGKEEGWGI